MEENSGSAPLTDPEFGSYSIVHELPLSGKKVCYFAGYSYYHEYADYTFYYLHAIARAGFELVFISSSRLSPQSVSRLKECCAVIIEKENKGTDFGAWRVALSVTGFGKGIECMLLANDSVFGPLRDMDAIIDTFLQSEDDFYGLTLSYQRGVHLQSFFLLFKQNVLCSQTWKGFWENMVLHKDKNDVVIQYEIGLTNVLHNDGFKYGVWCKWHEAFTVSKIRKKLLKSETLFHYWYKNFSHAGAQFNRQVNPCSFYWQELTEECAFPFLKKELIQHQNLNISYGVFDNWKEVIQRNSSYDIRLITQIILCNQLKEALQKNFPAAEFACHLEHPEKDANGYFHHLSYLLPGRVPGGAAYPGTTLVITDKTAEKDYAFLFAYIDEVTIDDLIEKQQNLTALFPALQEDQFLLLLPFAKDVVPFLNSLANDNMIIIKPSVNNELAMVNAAYHLIRSRKQQSGLPGLYNIMDISDIGDSKLFLDRSSWQKSLKTEKELFDEIFDKYQQAYESLPAWYKHIGQLIKIVQGNKVLRFGFRHKKPPKSNSKLDELVNWYHYEYDVLPGWYKNIGKKLKKKP